MLKSIKSNNSPGHLHNGHSSVVGLSFDSCPGNISKEGNKMNKFQNLTKDQIIDKIEELQHGWVNEGIAEVQEKVGMNHGDCSLELDLEFREVFKSLAKCTYKQLKENGYIK